MWSCQLVGEGEVGGMRQLDGENGKGGAFTRRRPVVVGSRPHPYTSSSSWPNKAAVKRRKKL